jgi:hypothetical protein
MKNKMSLLLVLPLFVSTFLYASAVRDTLVPNRKNTSHITLLNGTSLDGYIVHVTDSTVKFLSRNDYLMGNNMNSRTIPAENILEIKKRFRKGITTGGGLLTGLLGGALFGFGIGLSSDCDDPDGKCDIIDRLFSTKSFRASFILSGILGTAGALIGLFSPKKSKASFSINGKRENIRNNKNGLLFY